MGYFLLNIDLLLFTKCLKNQLNRAIKQHTKFKGYGKDMFLERFTIT